MVSVKRRLPKPPPPHHMNQPEKKKINPANQTVTKVSHGVDLNVLRYRIAPKRVNRKNGLKTKIPLDGLTNMPSMLNNIWAPGTNELIW
jgi:hypothetical protein